MSSIQIIVITCSSERKAKMQQQLLELNIPFPVKYLDGSTPENSKDFLPNNTADWYNRILCCTRSHIRAILDAANINYEYSIILEDDAALNITDFVDIINKLIKIWNTDIISPIISLGWSPRQTYPSHGDLSKTFELDDKYKYSYRHEMGTIGYIINNKLVKKYTKLIDCPTFNLLHSNVIKHNINLDKITYTLDIGYADNFIPAVFKPAVLSPPIICEYVSKSIINKPDNHNVNSYWKSVYNEKLKLFWSYK